MLYDSQREVLDEVGGKDIIYHLGTGSGKTILSLVDYIERTNCEEELLILCPNSKYKEGGWDREIEVVEKFYGVKINYRVVPYSKMWLTRKKRGENARVKNPDFHQYLGRFVIFDEIHFIKNPTSQRGMAGIKIAQNSTGFIGLSGEPLANGWIDSMSYLIMFGYERNKTQIIRKYAKGLDQYYTPYGWNHEALSEIWNEIHIYRDTKDMIDLPKLTIKDVHFKPSTKYKKIKKDRICDDVVYDTLPKLFAGLRQFANLKDKGEYVNDFLESTTTNVVIFYNFKVELAELEKMIPKGKKVYYANGDNYTIPTKPEWSGVKNSVSLVQYQAGGTGIEMQYADTVIFFSPTYSYQDYYQAQGRVYRSGQPNPVEMYRFVTKGTVETKIWKALKNKQDFNPREDNL